MFVGGNGNTRANAYEGRAMPSILDDDAVKPSKEVTWISEHGMVLVIPCTHKKIPGLDAMFCTECRVWYVDGEERGRRYKRKKKGKK